MMQTYIFDGLEFPFSFERGSVLLLNRKRLKSTPYAGAIMILQGHCRE